MAITPMVKYTSNSFFPNFFSFSMVLSPFRLFYNFFHWPVTAEGSPQAALSPLP